MASSFRVLDRSIDRVQNRLPFFMQNFKTVRGLN